MDFKDERGNTVEVEFVDSLTERQKRKVSIHFIGIGDGRNEKGLLAQEAMLRATILTVAGLSGEEDSPADVFIEHASPAVYGAVLTEAMKYFALSEDDSKNSEESST